MITDEMLREAAEKSSKVYVRYLEQGYNPEFQHDFSKNFERKIRKLRRKANHPVLYRSLQRIASILLAIALGGIVWLSVDIEARASFFGWIREFYETYIVYRFEGNHDSNTSSEEYRPTWVPTGYAEFHTSNSEDDFTVIYANDIGQALTFSYSRETTGSVWYVKNTMISTKQAYVNDMPADILIADNIETANGIVWVDSQNTAFYISGFLDEADLIRMAESVQKNL